MDINTATEKAYCNGHEAGKQYSGMKWIPVTEQVPELDVDVLAFNGDYIFVSQYYRSYFASWDKEGHLLWVKDQYAKDPTHWMPLPNPPTE